MPSDPQILDEFCLNDQLRQAIVREFGRLGVVAVVSHPRKLGRTVETIVVFRQGEPNVTLKAPLHLLLSSVVRADSLGRFISTWRDIPIPGEEHYASFSLPPETALKRYLRAVAKSLGVSANMALGNPFVAFALASAEASLAANAVHARTDLNVSGQATRAGLVAANGTLQRLLERRERYRDHLQWNGRANSEAAREASGAIGQRIATNRQTIHEIDTTILPKQRRNHASNVFQA